MRRTTGPQLSSARRPRDRLMNSTTVTAPVRWVLVFTLAPPRVTAASPQPQAPSSVSAGQRERARTARQERADDALYLLAFQKERVVAVVALHLVVAHVLVGGAQGADDLLELVGRVQPVSAERQHEEARRHVAEGLHEAPVPAREVEVVEGTRDVEIRVGVEAVGERESLAPQIPLHLEIGREGERVVGDVAQAAPELLLHGLAAEIGDVADHARHAEALH